MKYTRIFTYPNIIAEIIYLFYIDLRLSIYYTETM